METPEGRFVVKQRLFSFPTTGDLDVFAYDCPFQVGPQAGYRKASATLPPIISYTNLQENEKHLQRWKTIEHYSSAISNPAGGIFNSAQFGPCRSKNVGFSYIGPEVESKAEEHVVGTPMNSRRNSVALLFNSRKPFH